MGATLDGHVDWHAGQNLEIVPVAGGRALNVAQILFGFGPHTDLIILLRETTSTVNWLARRRNPITIVKNKIVILRFVVIRIHAILICKIFDLRALRSPSPVLRSAHWKWITIFGWETVTVSAICANVFFLVQSCELFAVGEATVLTVVHITALSDLDFEMVFKI